MADSLDHIIRNVDRLGGPAQASFVGRKIREEQNRDRSGEDASTQVDEGVERGKEASEHAQLRADKHEDKQKQEKKKGLVGKAEEAAVMPAKMGAKRLLQSAWFAVFSVWGFVPGIIYVNTHAFLRLIFPKMFCQLGEEWYPEQLRKIMAKAGFKTNAIGIGEKMLLLALDILLLIMFYSIFSLIIELLNAESKAGFVWKAGKLVKEIL